MQAGAVRREAWRGTQGVDVVRRVYTGLALLVISTVTASLPTIMQAAGIRAG